MCSMQFIPEDPETSQVLNFEGLVMETAPDTPRCLCRTLNGTSLEGFNLRARGVE